MDVRFVILSASGKHRTTTKRLPILVGRSEEARLRITQDCVSRRHCEFLEQDGRVFVRDLGSTNGTLLDEEEIPASVPTPVRSGGVVKVGGVALRVEYESAFGAAETPPSAEGDTVPLDAGIGACAEEAVAEDEPADAEPGVAAGDAAVSADGPAEFGFLAAGAPAAAAEAPEWPGTAETSDPDDGDLDDFFKSLK